MSSVRALSLLAALGLLAAGCDQENAEGQSGKDAQSRHQEPRLPPTARPEMLADLRLAHAAPRHPSDGGGRAWLELAQDEQATVVAGTPRRWTIVYEAGEEGVQPGGFVRLTVPQFWGWSGVQSSDPRSYGYTTGTTEAEGVELEVFEARGWWIDFRVRGRALARGERVRIVYGAGPALAIADRYAERGAQLWISVDGDGDGYATVLPDSPTVDVLAGPPASLRLILPSTAEPGDEVPLRIALLDGQGNAGTQFTGEVALSVLPDGMSTPETVAFTRADRGLRKLELSPADPGVYRVLANADLGGFSVQAVSNPLLVEHGVAPIRWGDFHGHSNVSDGTGTPEDFLLYARDVAGLDAVALTDHDHWGMLFLDEHPELWEEVQTISNRFDDPGTFVSIVGFEWTSWIHGHRHVLYFDGSGPMLSSIDPEVETPAQLWKALRGEQALTFAHHSAGGPIATNWDFAPDPELEPVTEVASVHGQSEAADAPYRIYSALAGNFVRDALDRGYRLGFIGSGDSHDAHPGLAQIASPSGSGIAALLTDDLTRAGVYRALRERRSYATNGERIVLRFAIDAHRMGSTITARTGEPGTHLLYVRAIGTAPLAGIDVVKNGQVLQTIPGEQRFELTATLGLEPLAPGDYVYVRVIQLDRGCAWSSPIFVE